MYLDILIFAGIAAFLVYRLNAVLGTRNDNEKQRPNPFVAAEEKPRAPKQAVIVPHPSLTQAQPLSEEAITKWADPAMNTEGLKEIKEADPDFDVEDFIAGARYAFETIVSAYHAGDRETLKPLLSPKLYTDFEHAMATREAAGHTSTLETLRINALRIVEAHLGGAMAYVTVDYDVEQTTLTRNAAGEIVDGAPDRVSHVEDIWTFTRDTRSDDPSWILIETRTAEK